MPIPNPEEAHRIFADAVNSGNVEAVVTLYDREARIVDQPGKPAVGQEAIREAFRNLLALKGQMHAVTTTVSRAGDLALLRAHWTYEAAGAAGELSELSGDSVEVLRRQPDGSWLFTIDLPFGNDEGILPATAGNKTLVRRYFAELVNRGDLTVADEIIAPDIAFHGPVPKVSPNLSDVVRGREAFKGFMGALHETFSDVHFDVEDLIADGDKVAARWTLHLTDTGGFMGRPPTGRKVAVTGLEHFCITEGLIREIWAEFDLFILMQQLGASAEAASATE